MEYLISTGIIDSYFQKLRDHLKVDVAIAGGGPSGLVAAYFLAKKGYKVAVFERKLAPGGGMWGGAMMFNEIVVQKEALPLLDEFDIGYRHYREELFTADSVHASSALIYKATRAGACILNCFSIEDVVLQNERISGVVVNWAPVHREKLHVDPLIILSHAVVDTTGHDCEISRIVERKNGIILKTPTGSVVGEKSLNAAEAEKMTLINTGEIYPGLFVSGMAANGVNGSCRMGPVFGGMLMSGRKVAGLIASELERIKISEE